jgi:hypothetical protein
MVCHEKTPSVRRGISWLCSDFLISQKYGHDDNASAGFGTFRQYGVLVGGGCRGVSGPVPQPLSMSAGVFAPGNLDKFCQFITV